jgi:hypothetical protein
MRATRLIGCLAVALLAVPIGARAAEDEAQRFKALEERMRVLEDKLAASSATIEAQQELLQRATPAVSQGSSLDAFFNKLEIGGSVTGSYLYNFNNPQTPGPSSVTQPLNQFNSRHNEFSFDAAKLDISKAAANPGEAGFALEMLYGQNGDILRRAADPGNTFSGFGNATSDDGVFIQEAYGAYNLNGITFKLGKFETLMGYEVLDSYKNPNVTHGLLFTWAIPLYHEGLLATGSFAEGFSWSAGIVNGFNNVIENNDAKAFIGQLAATSGPISGSLNVFWGAEASDNTASVSPNGPGSMDPYKIFDAVLNFAATDTISLWANADYGLQKDQAVVGQANNKDADYWGLALGGKIKLTDKLGFALRGEYLRDDDALRLGSFMPAGLPSDNARVKLYSLTGTVSYMLAKDLMMRGEVRWDHADDDLNAPTGAIFPDSAAASPDDSSVLGIVEVSYMFD